jgi:sphingomyelin phosphodiesterase acid-like 3
MPSRTPFSIKLLASLTICASLICAHLTAQTHTPVHGPARVRPAVTPITLPALFLSDIHFDPYLDPAKAAALNAAPATEWPRILAAPSTQTITAAQQTAYAACPSDKDPGTDTSYALWQSTLAELKKTASPSRFVILPGDLLAHKFDCKYKALIPGATNDGYLAFTLKTVRYVLASLRAALPGVPVYAALGNNDSGCVDYALDPDHDAFLAALAPLVAEVANLSSANRTTAEHDFAGLGAFNAPLAALPHTRIISFDDLFLSAKYVTCSGGKNDPTPSAAAIAWLKTQLDQARAAGDRVWFISHIPPGIDLYATARKTAGVCGSKPTMFLGSNELSDTLAAYPDVVRLAIFGHTHDDELRLIPSGDSSQRTTSNVERTTPQGVPLKVVGSITPIHGNRPTFTLARVNPAAATLADYTVMMASDPTAAPITWSREYTWSTAYRQPAFDAASLTALITGFEADPKARSAESQAYTRFYYPAASGVATANAAIISAAWQPYVCSLSHLTAKSFAACACGK